MHWNPLHDKWGPVSAMTPSRDKRKGMGVNDGLEMSRFYVVVQRFCRFKWKAIWSVGVVVAGPLRRRAELLLRW